MSKIYPQLIVCDFNIHINTTTIFMQKIPIASGMVTSTHFTNGRKEQARIIKIKFCRKKKLIWLYFFQQSFNNTFLLLLPRDKFSRDLQFKYHVKCLFLVEVITNISICEKN